MDHNLKKCDVIIVGGGASGLLAAATAAEMGMSCLLLEKKDRTAKKILITGKGRCNITNDCEIEDIFLNIRRNPRFLYSSIYSFSNTDIINFFNSKGVKTKTERGGRVFPESDRASDIADALYQNAISSGVAIKTDSEVSEVTVKNSKVTGVICNGQFFESNKVILACGGASYPATGSDGSGFKLAGQAGHSIITPKGSLTGLNTKQTWTKEVMGVTLKNVGLRLFDNEKELFQMQGELLLSHFGITGPIVLTGSASLADSSFKNTKAFIDLKPALNHEMLDKRIIRDFSENLRKQFKNSLEKLLPARLIPAIIQLSGIDPDKKVNQITQTERRNLVDLFKNLKLDITGLRPLSEAIVTAGGVCTMEINPSTLESKLVKDLYFCGEMIDVDANTGGYNLTIAFSTGRLAGASCAEGFR